MELEPGLAFGTGSHPTTRLCLEIMEDYIHPASTVLDVGCGSGILSIAALLLGAKSAFGVDIDKLAVKTALANAEKNGFTPPVFDAVSGDLSENVSGRYSVVIANIVADVIMKLTPQAANLLKENGVFITGGIIDPRKDEVEACFAKTGLRFWNTVNPKAGTCLCVKENESFDNNRLRCRGNRIDSVRNMRPDSKSAYIA